jgi:hypothetical protein
VVILKKIIIFAAFCIYYLKEQLINAINSQIKIENNCRTKWKINFSGEFSSELEISWASNLKAQHSSCSSLLITHRFHQFCSFQFKSYAKISSNFPNFLLIVSNCLSLTYSISASKIQLVVKISKKPSIDPIFLWNS